MQRPLKGTAPDPMRLLPPITKAFLLACVGMFCLLVLAPQFAPPLELWPLDSEFFRPWQVLSYALLHVNFQHLFFNMLGIWMFGIELEQLLGPKRFAMLLLASILSAAAGHMLLNLVIANPTRIVGASGATFGLLLAYGMFFAERIVEPVFPPIPMKTKYLVAIFGLIELVTGMSSNNGLSHVAHLGGMVGAFVLIRHWRSPKRRK